MQESPKVFADYHHGGAARGQLLVFDRLNYEVYFGGVQFTDRVNNEFGIREGTNSRGDWLPCLPGWLIGMGGVPDYLLDDDGTYPKIIDFDEFLAIDWDIFLCTRIETQKVFKWLKEVHPNGKDIRVIGVTGNDATVFDWDFIKNLMASDEATYRLAPWDINKIHYSQEMGFQFQNDEFVPVDEKSLKTVTCFVNCWPHFDEPWQWGKDNNLNQGKCPHCDQPVHPSAFQEPVQPYSIWKGAEKLLEGYTFNDYGIGCKIGIKPEIQLPVEYHSGALTIHMKTYDGYGFSMLQAIACGRPVVVPYRFHRYRTAGRYLIPNLTCFESTWDARALAHVIGYVTENVDRANHYAEACWKASKNLFNWEHEAFRVGEFLRRLI